MDDKNVLLNQLRIDRTRRRRERRQQPPLGAHRRKRRARAGIGGRRGVVPHEAQRHSGCGRRCERSARRQRERRRRQVHGRVDARCVGVRRRAPLRRRSLRRSILRVTDVLIEEGQRVKEGEVIARLDDSNTRAQPAAGAGASHASRGESESVEGCARRCRADLQAQRAAVRSESHQRAGVGHRQAGIQRGGAGPTTCARACSKSRAQVCWSPSAFRTTPSSARRSRASS